jgi:hypothetical protein
MAGVTFNIHGWRGPQSPLPFREDLTIACTMFPSPSQLCDPFLQIKELLPALKALSDKSHSYKRKARIIKEICQGLELGGSPCGS